MTSSGQERLRAALAAVDGARGGEADIAMLDGLAWWGAVLATTAPGIALVAGVEPAPPGATALEAPGPVVAVASPVVAFAAVGDGPVARWAAGGDAVRAVLDVVGPPAGSGAVAEAALAGAPADGGFDVGAVVAALGAAVRGDRARTSARLHDGPVQELTAATLLLDSALWGQAIDADAREPVEQGLAALRAAISSCRALMTDLRRPT
jgi:signal transduction histidine kinase